QLTPIEQPAFEVGHRGALGRASLQQVEEGLESLPLAKGGAGRNELAWRKGRQFPKGQQTHARSMPTDPARQKRKVKGMDDIDALAWRSPRGILRSWGVLKITKIPLARPSGGYV